MSEGVPEDAGGQSISPSDLDQSPSPDPEGGQHYLSAVYSQALTSWTEYEHYLGIRQHYQHKGRWSWFLLVAIGGMILYQMVILFLVGDKRLDFTDYDWLLPGLLVQNLGLIVGLATYAVKHLFSDITLKNGSKRRR